MVQLESKGNRSDNLTLKKYSDSLTFRNEGVVLDSFLTSTGSNALLNIQPSTSNAYTLTSAYNMNK